MYDFHDRLEKTSIPQRVLLKDDAHNMSEKHNLSNRRPAKITFCLFKKGSSVYHLTFLPTQVAQLASF